MSIRARLLWIALLATLLPALLISWRFVGEREGEIASATRQLPEIAASIASDLSEKIQGTEQLHYGLSRARDLDTRDRAACSAFLSRVRDKYPQYTGILTIHPDGRLFCDSLNTGRNLDLTDRAYFKQALQSHAGITLEPVFGRLTGIPVLQIAYPVRSDSGALSFVLLASLNLAHFVQTNQRYSQMAGHEILLIDHNGMALAWSGSTDRGIRPGSRVTDGNLLRFAASNRDGAVEELSGPDGNPRVWAVAHPRLINEAGIHILVSLPRNLLVAAANRRFAEDMALIAAIGLLVFAGMGYLAELGIRRHVGKIGRMLKSIGRDEQWARIPEPHPRGELGALMTLLNDTAEALERQRANIRDLDEKLRQSQRLESVGQLTGGMAHDFNNLLTVIMGNAELLSEQLAGDPRLAGTADTVLKAAQRGADLTQRLLAFARRQPLDPRPVNVDALVAGMTPMLRGTLGEQVEIGFSPMPGLWPALADASQLESALLNLCINARDAMPNGGRVTIETANQLLDEDFGARHGDLLPGPYVLLAVSDTGTGIAPAHASRVFEPFFTTKEKDKGTGLGLSMVYGFIKQSGGQINIDSELGRGTTVSMYLPRAEVPVNQHPRDDQGESIPEQGAETILMVEDDELVRQFVYRQLVGLGYTVL
ncbi:ATP-binding protein [Lacisediminimonas sp.]|uniref:ATP-binding protein n=1 Tax=Lacisediminimonas sp. TaxID=3060582 RepID=UPI002722F778|nr:ATP-binding protein [Lacisediminimonas sp.]MDO8298464.1 ATP-binding protein [Lacisediminimonas sp.]